MGVIPGVRPELDQDEPNEPAGRALPDEPPAGPFQLIRSAPLAVWVLFLLHLVLLFGWSVLTPAFHAPDEPNHADAAVQLATGNGWKRPGTDFVSNIGLGLTEASPYGRAPAQFTLSGRPVPQSDAVPRSERPKLKQLDKPRFGQSGTTIQQMVQHPPGYYLVEAAVLKLFGGTNLRWDWAIGLMRLVSVLMVAPLPLLCWASAWRLSSSRIAGISAAVLPLGVPELSHIGGSINNDNLLTLSSAVVTLGVVCVLRGNTSWRVGLFTGVGLGVGLFAKGLALVLVPFVAAAYLLRWHWDRQERREAAKADAGSAAPADDSSATAPVAQSRLRGFVPGLAALVVAFVIGGWWWVVNVLRYHKVQPGVPGFPLGKFLDHRYGEFLGYLIKAMPLRWWSSLGWYEVNLPWKFINTATFVVIALSIYAVVRARSRLRISLALLLWPLLGTYLLVIAQGVRHFLSTHYVAGLSGRYLFDGVAGLAVVVGVGASLLPRKLARWTPLVLLIGAAVMQAKTVQLAVRRWWQPSGGGLRQAWGALSSWSPWPPEVLQAVVAIGAVLVVIAVVTLVRAGRSTPETPAVRQAV